jgi:TetR/AcrR family transcriptional repressor of lmrAB and yxaGH operons
MTRQGQETRMRLIRAAAALYQSGGYHATGVAAILSHAGVPKGSMYHHFPNGKQELTIATVDWIADELATRFARASQGDTSAEKQVMRLFTDTAAWLEGHDYSQGALLSLLAQEVEPGEVALRARIANAYRDATTQLSAALEAGGAPQPEELATTVLAALDGCIARARAQRSSVGLHRAGEMLAAVVRQA